MGHRGTVNTNLKNARGAVGCFDAVSVCRHCEQTIVHLLDDGIWVHEDPDGDPAAYGYGFQKCGYVWPDGIAEPPSGVKLGGLKRAHRLLPGGVPKYIRIYDNGGWNRLFHRPTCEYLDERDFPGWETGPVHHPETGVRLIVVPDRGTYDRYTVVYTRRGVLSTFYRGMSGPPYGPRHPQGFGQAGEIPRPSADVPKGRRSVAFGDVNAWGSRRIPWERLPDDCKEVVIEDYKTLWGLP